MAGAEGDGLLRADRDARARDGARRTIGCHRPRRAWLQAPRHDSVRGAGGAPAVSGKTIRVLLVDDHAVVRAGYRTLLAKHEGLTVVGEACDAASAYQGYKDTQPDVVIMDISMPGAAASRSMQHSCASCDGCRARPRLHHARAAPPDRPAGVPAPGARGYVTKSSPPDLLVSAVRDVAARPRRPSARRSPRSSRSTGVQRGKDRTGGPFAARVRRSSA